MSTMFTLTTTLSEEECLSRLRKSLSPARVFTSTMPAKETFYGTIRGSRFRVCVVRPGDPRKNSFMPFLYGAVSPSLEGSRITGVIRRHTFIYFFMALWYTAVLPAGALIWHSLLSRSPDLTSLFSVLALIGLACWSAVMLVVPWVVWAVCAGVNRDREEVLRSFVAKALDAREQTSENAVNQPMHTDLAQPPASRPPAPNG